MASGNSKLGFFRRFELLGGLGGLAILATGLIWIGGLKQQIATHETDIKALQQSIGALSGVNKDVSSQANLLKELQQALADAGVKTHHFTATTVDEMHTRRQFQFMTPSSDTWRMKQEIYKEQPEVLENFRWQLVTEEKVEEFGRVLIAEGFTRGWRRYPHSGQGRDPDVGWWWVTTVDEGFDVNRFVKFYSDFWGTREIYLEEFSTLGDVLPDKFIPHPNLPPKKTDH
jgi:hypothetical protein